MKPSATRRNGRLLQLLGILLAFAGLAGFWLTRDVPKAQLGEDQQEILGIGDDAEERFTASFVVAGRDYDIARYADSYRRVGNRCVGGAEGRFQLGSRTDTILYVQLIGSEMHMVAIPRDVWLPQWQTRINAMYGYQGAEGLERSVEEVLGLPVDYHVVVSIDIFEDLVDALGGVDVNIPYRMFYVDCAAGLEIDFEEGPAHLDGADAAEFVRYRETQRGDIDRLDNVKRLARAVMARVRDPAVLPRLPAMAEAVLANVETNASPALVARLLPKLPSLALTQTATLPVREIALESGTQVLAVDRAATDRFLAQIFGGEVPEVVEAPATPVLVTDRSGREGLGAEFRDRLVAMGAPADRILLREGSFDPNPTTVLATAPHWTDADWYAGLLRTGKQQIDRLPHVEGVAPGIEIVLGEDAVRASLVAAGSLPPPPASAVASDSGAVPVPLSDAGLPDEKEIP